MAISRCMAGWLVFGIAWSAQAQHVGVAAIVNDEIITSMDVEARRDLVLALNGMPPTNENKKLITPRIIDALVDETLEMQEAKRLSIAISDKEVEGAIDQLDQGRRAGVASLRQSLAEKSLSANSLKAQLRAQLAWNKVVQRKLRRSVSISQDEISRAQAAAASDPGAQELQIVAISILVPEPSQQAAQAEFAASLSQRLQQGEPLERLAQELATRPDVRVRPPSWVPEDSLQPAIQQALRALQPGEISPPLPSANTFQLIQLVERRVIRKLPDSTELVVREIALPLPEKRTAETMLALRSSTEALRQNPELCNDAPLSVPRARAKFIRTNLGNVSRELKSIVTHLNVGEASVPMASEESVRLFALCERIEPAQGNMPPAAEVQKRLFAEKMELEAQKHLRNLRRDAFIEIKAAPDHDKAA